MRKSFLLLPAAVGGVLALATTSMAALGFHDTSSNTTIKGGACAQCHNTTATAVFRGWGNTLSGVPVTGWYTRNVSALCWSCHNSGALGGAHDVTATAFGGANATPTVHGWRVASAPGNSSIGTQETYTATNLPYVVNTGENLQCTTCHNVHNDQYYPYMMKADIDALCKACHSGRTSSAVLNTIVNASGNYSTHPVDLAYADVVGNGATTLRATAHAGMTVVHNYTAASVAAQPLGGHFVSATGANTGGNSPVSCRTCHAVHGANNGAGVMTTSVEDLLAVPNNAATASAPSALCEGCHGGPQSTPVSAVGTGTDHPIDNDAGRTTFYPTGVAMPASFTNGAGDTNTVDTGASPFYATAGYNAFPQTGSGAPVCSSCHDIHGGIPATSLLRRTTTLNTAASVDQMNETGWCFVCHSASAVTPKLHHSNTANDDGTFTSVVPCGGCHGTQTGGVWHAHNGFWGFAVGADNVLVANNATAAPAAGLSYTYERLCEDCHIPTNPTLFDTTPTSLIVLAANSPRPAAHGVTTGTMSHEINNVDNNSTYNTVIKNTSWGTTLAYANNEGYASHTILSKVGVAAGAGAVGSPGGLNSIVCESCHNLLTNAGALAPFAVGGVNGTTGWKANLLVYGYEDNLAGVAVAESPDIITGATNSDLCRGCHAQSNTNWPFSTANDGTSFVHAPAAHTIKGYAYPAANTPYHRTSTAVLTTPVNQTSYETSTADMAGAPGLFSYPAANTLDCDSCHRPHNADAQGTVTGLTGTPINVILENGTSTAAEDPKTLACMQCHDPLIMPFY